MRWIILESEHKGAARNEDWDPRLIEINGKILLTSVEWILSIYNF